MEKFIINGGRRLDGSINISSAKNAVLPMMCASLLTKEQLVIKNCPKLSDVLVLRDILISLGVKADFVDDDLVLNSSSVSGYSVDEIMMKKLRSSIFLMGALLSRLKRAVLYMPGGCNIGKRPIDIHIFALNSMGVKFVFEGDKIDCSAKKIKGSIIELPFPSVGATLNVILTAVLAEGQTIITNSAREPEIVDLINMLNKMGAKIYGAGKDRIVINGVKKLRGVVWKPVFDRIEAGTYIIATKVLGGRIELKNCFRENIYSVINKFCDNTCKMDIKNGIINFSSMNSCPSFYLRTGPFPSFPTDLQPMATVLACVSNGTSFIKENVFENRFEYTKELLKTGADIIVKGNVAIVHGLKLQGANMHGKDLRGTAALVIAGLCAEGKSEVSGVEYCDRGYYKIEEKFSTLGADIKRIT